MHYSEGVLGFHARVVYQETRGGKTPTRSFPQVLPA